MSNDEKRCGKGSIVAIIKGTKSDIISPILKKIAEGKRRSVKYIAMDFAPSMAKIARESFSKATQVIDRFHVQKLINDTVQDCRVKHRWVAQQIEDEHMENCKKNKVKYKPSVFQNEETVAQLFIRARYALNVSRNEWPESQVERMGILFNHFPELEDAYQIAQDFRHISFSKTQVEKVKQMHKNHVYNITNENLFRADKKRILSETEFIVAFYKTQLNTWYNNIEKNDTDGMFKSVMKTFQQRANEIINYYIHGFTNARAEALNAKIKNFRRNLRGVKNKTYFQFRLKNLLG